jgi:tetratricopeptide (TPR) repeat protein
MSKLILPAIAMASPSNEAAIQELFDQANTIVERADALLDEDPELAKSLYGQGAALYRACIEQGGIDNANLHANLGNAEYRAGNNGLAIVSYRRAERLDPTNAIARAGLVAARSNVSVLVDPDPKGFAIDAVFIWRKWVPRSAVFGAGVIAWLGLWGALGLRAMGLWRMPTGWVVAFSAVALVTLGGQYAEQRLLYHGQNLVVTAPEIVGHNGPNPDAYQPSFADPLVSGVECVLLEERDGWRRVRLNDGRTTWLPADALETI